MSRHARGALGWLAALACVAGCASPPRSVVAPSAPAPTPSATATAAADPLGPRPLPAEPPAFQPAPPTVLAGPEGSTVWLVERHGLPLVSISAVVPWGSAAEPAAQAGLAWVAADMVDEGAGTRDALAFSTALDALGAQLSSSADRDTSAVSLQVLASRFDEALGLFADALVRPRHEARDFARVAGLWRGALQARAEDPNDVARVVTAAAFFGEASPYGHPHDGTLASSARLRLADVRAWHRAIWRPDAATFVVVGDVTRASLEAQLARAFAGWKAPSSPRPALAAPPAPAAARGVRTVVVDRPGAPQVVLSLARVGVAAADPDRARLDLLNVALGGSFTSRLNQNLREDHGWTYGARSRFQAQRGVGAFVARAAIRTDAITPALGETLKEIRALAAEGPTADEVAKVRAQAGGDAVEAYATLHGVSAALAASAGLGLPPDHDARALASQRAATRDDLAALARAHLALDDVTLVLVGPRDAATAALAAHGLPAPEARDAEGRAVR